MTDSLRLEMVKFGVGVSVVEPARYDASTSCSSPKMINHTYFIIQIVYRREGNVSIIYANILLSKQSSLRWCTGKGKRQKKHITATVGNLYRPLALDTFTILPTFNEIVYIMFGSSLLSFVL
jgi:hypothetical protein